jgi:hypothetical protein
MAQGTNECVDGWTDKRMNDEKHKGERKENTNLLLAYRSQIF